MRFFWLCLVFLIVLSVNEALIVGGWFGENLAWRLMVLNAVAGSCVLLGFNLVKSREAL